METDVLLFDGHPATRQLQALAAVPSGLPMPQADARIRHLDIGLLVVVGFALRYLSYRISPNLHYPDEIFQVLEPAYRLVFGHGLVVWEYIVGIRSWLFPGFVAGLMLLGRQFGSDPDTIRLPVTLFMIAVSMTPIVCGYLWGWRLHGRVGGILVGAINAIWNDLVYMAPHTLSEVVAGDVLILALYLTAKPLERISTRRFFWVGFLFGLIFILRFPLGPALAIGAIYLCRLHVRARWLPLLAGAIAPVLLAGLLDFLTLGSPFQSIWWNFWLNIVANISVDFGTETWAFIVAVPFLLWGGAAPIILFGAAVGARRAVLPLLVAGTIFATHMVIAHKEVRFLFPALPLLLTLAGIATADIVVKIRQSFPQGPISPGSVTILALLFWVFASVGVAGSPGWQKLWSNDGDIIRAFQFLSRDSDLCGVALVDDDWLRSPGSAGLPQNAPIYATTAAELPRDADGFDAIVAPDGFAVSDTRFVQQACFGRDPTAHSQRSCVWKRPGFCAAGVAHVPPVNWPPYFRDAQGNLIDARTHRPW
jgi:GPI mannosyltransferase 3